MRELLKLQKEAGAFEEVEEERGGILRTGKTNPTRSRTKSRNRRRRGPGGSRKIQGSAALRPRLAEEGVKRPKRQATKRTQRAVGDRIGAGRGGAGRYARFAVGKFSTSSTNIFIPTPSAASVKS